MTHITVLEPREVPLGGIRAMTVHRTLPHKDISMIGAWCFVDHYGPNRIGVDSPGMDVAPHPHTGLQTLSWLFDGTISHHDTGDAHALVHPGEMNLMTAGSGIAHTEVTTPDTTLLHGVQLWIALPDSARFTDRAFEHYVPPVLALGDGASARVFMGGLPGRDGEGATSPVTAHTPLFGAEITLDAGARVAVPLRPGFEYGALCDTGSFSLTTTTRSEEDPSAENTVHVAHRDLAVTDPGATQMTLTAHDEGTRLVLLGGEPFTEEIIMWWNFVGRTSEEITRYRDEWEAHSQRFGTVEGYEGTNPRFAAPPLPGVRLRSRRRRRDA